MVVGVRVCYEALLADLLGTCGPLLRYLSLLLLGLASVAITHLLVYVLVSDAPKAVELTVIATISCCPSWSCPSPAHSSTVSFDFQHAGDEVEAWRRGVARREGQG